MMLKVMPVHRAMGFYKLRNVHYLIEVFRADDGVDVHSKARILLAAGLDSLNRVECLGKIPRHGTNGILHLVQPVHGDIEVEAEFGIFFANTGYPFRGALGQQAVGWKIDPPDAILLVKEMDDVGQIAPKHRLAPGKPEIAKPGHGEGQLADLVPGQIAALVQLFPIKASPALGIAS